MRKHMYVSATTFRKRMEPDTLPDILRERFALHTEAPVGRRANENSWRLVSSLGHGD